MKFACCARDEAKMDKFDKEIDMNIVLTSQTNPFFNLKKMCIFLFGVVDQDESLIKEKEEY